MGSDHGVRLQRRLGRSLEKAGSSTALAGPRIAGRCGRRLWRVPAPRSSGCCAGWTPEEVHTFLAGFLERTAPRGGVCDPFLKAYAEEQGNGIF